MSTKIRYVVRCITSVKCLKMSNFLSLLLQSGRLPPYFWLFRWEWSLSGNYIRCLFRQHNHWRIQISANNGRHHTCIDNLNMSNKLSKTKNDHQILVGRSRRITPPPSNCRIRARSLSQDRPRPFDPSWAPSYKCTTDGKRKRRKREQTRQSVVGFGFN